MKFNFSIRRLLTVVMAVAICLWMYMNHLEHRALRAQMNELKELYQKLTTLEDRLAYLEIESEHYPLVANAQVISMEVALDAQVRRSTTQLEIETIRNRVAQLLNQNDDGRSDERKREILSSEIARCENVLVRLEDDPNMPAAQIAQVTRQLARFKGQLPEIPK